jgi:hypothetical protein
VNRAVVLLFLVLVLTAFASASTQDSSFDSVAFLLGEWKPATAAKAPTADTVFHSALDGQIIVRESRRFVKRGDGPASQRDLLVIYKDSDDGQQLRAVYFDEDGRTIHYTVATTGVNEVTFVSEGISGKPRYRLSYKLDSNETLRAKLDVAAPYESRFKPYQHWAAHRVELQTEGWL